MPIIRPARLEDAGAIALLSRQLGYPADEAKTRALLEFMLADSEHDVLVFDEDGVIAWAGLAVAHSLTSKPHAHLVGLVVAEGRRSMGIGTSMMEAAEAWGRRRGLATLRLRTNMIRAEAHRFYESLGYARVKEQRVYEKEL